jgi:hypothetical protein
MNIPEDIHQQIENHFIDYEDYDKSAYVRGREIYAANFGYRLALQKIEERQQEIELLKQSNTDQLSQIGKLFADKMEQAKEIEGLKKEIDKLNHIIRKIQCPPY